MKIKIKKIGFVELGIYCTFLLLPFTLFLNKIVFKDFRIVGFGSFSVSERSARAGRNPQTGKTIQIPAKKVVRFKAGAELEGQL